MRNNSIEFRPDLLKNLRDCHLAVDSTVLIDASKHTVFRDFMEKLSATDCTLVTVPNVIYEFERGARDMDTLKEYDEIVKHLGIVTLNQAEKLALNDNNRFFTILYNREAMGNRTKQGPSYTDSLLCSR